MSSDESWVAIDDVARHLSVAKESVYRWVESRGLPAHRVGRLLGFRISEVDNWVTSAEATCSEPSPRSAACLGPGCTRGKKSPGTKNSGKEQ